MDVKLLHGDCLRVMKTLADASVDAIVTDPPAGIAFMGKSWDVARSRGHFIDFLTPRMAEAYRVARPGTYALVWALPRTSHWTATAVEDAGWTIRDRVTHLFGTGYPKSKSCLKPAAEDWWLAYKPGGPMAPLQIEACRIESMGETTLRNTSGQRNGHSMNCANDGSLSRARVNGSASGRWPANVVLDEDAAAMLDQMSGITRSRVGKPRSAANGQGWGMTATGAEYDDSGGASRFFYCPKATAEDRGEGNDHPTVKSTDLMRWLCRLITPPGGLVLDPFAGSASTGKACIEEGFDFLGIESDSHYVEIGRRRLDECRMALPLFA